MFVSEPHMNFHVLLLALNNFMSNFKVSEYIYFEIVQDLWHQFDTINKVNTNYYNYISTAIEAIMNYSNATKHQVKKLTTL